MVVGTGPNSEPKSFPAMETSMSANLVDDDANMNANKAAERRFLWKLDLTVLPLLGELS